MKKELIMENYFITLCFNVSCSIIAAIFFCLSQSILLGILTVLFFLSSVCVFIYILKKNRMHNRMIKTGKKVKAQIIDCSLCSAPISFLKIKCQYFDKEKSELYVFEDKSYLNEISGKLYTIINRQNKIEVAYNPENPKEYYIFIEESVFIWNRSI